MPRISVVVPIYNVERYLDECLESLARQTFEDLEVIMVDDGSTDGSGAIAERFAGRDGRFRLIRQPNGGLSSARNTGTDAAGSEFLAFVDSDDVVASNAYELLLGALDETGSDFATGNVHRLGRLGTSQTQMHRKAFARTRLKTHVMKFRPLLADRTAWNKLWRRSFWDRQGYRFPEGRLHEDIPITLPAHFAARSVDVIAEPVYYWRVREAGELSITQRRLESGMLLDRLAAVGEVVDYLDRHGPRKGRRWYLESVARHDLRYHLDVLDGADDDYIELFMDRVNAFLDRGHEGMFDRLAAIHRLKWHLVRRRLVPELLEVLRFEKEELAETPPVRVDGDWYGDYPFRGDERLAIPASVYRLDQELAARGRIDDVRRDGARLRLRGFAFIEGIGAPAPDSQHLSVTAVRRGRLMQLRRRVLPLRLQTRREERPDATANTYQRLADVRWSGFEATLDPRALRIGGRWRDGTWELYVTIRAGGVKRRRGPLGFDETRPLPPVDLPAARGVSARVVPGPEATLLLEVRERWAAVRGHRLGGDRTLELSGELRAPPESAPALRLTRPGERAVSAPLSVESGRGRTRSFSASVPLGDLLGRPHETSWQLRLGGGGQGSLALQLPEEAEAAWEVDGRELALQRNEMGDAVLLVRAPRPVVAEARWTADGALELAGDAPSGEPPHELVAVAADHVEAHAFPVRAGVGGRFSARLDVARAPSLEGALPLGEGLWELRAGGAAGPPLTLAHAVRERLPDARVVDHKQFALAANREGSALLDVERNLDVDERGPYNQRRVRRAAYAGQRNAPLRDAVVYTSFGGRQYSDSPRAIHEELVRRGAPLEHLWVVWDGMCRVPESARVLRAGSREHHEALARARYVVSNDAFPDWFERREGQVCVQTWPGTPVRRRGRGMPLGRRPRDRANRRWQRQVANWQYVVAPNSVAAGILRESYGVEGEIVEAGYPRNDPLARRDGAAARERVGERLGLSPDRRVVLYAPTYRDHLVAPRGSYRLEFRLDAERLRAALGDDTALLVRAHPYVADAVPEGANGFVRDVSRYPDPSELLLAADVLVTDYSSMMFDFANTGRPMLFFVYDLDEYQQEERRFEFDFVRTVPGPLLRTTDEVAEALREVDGVPAEFAGRYEEFAATFCRLDDGRAAERVVERVFAR